MSITIFKLFTGGYYVTFVVLKLSSSVMLKTSVFAKISLTDSTPLFGLHVISVVNVS